MEDTHHPGRDEGTIPSFWTLALDRRVCTPYTTSKVNEGRRVFLDVTPGSKGGTVPRNVRRSKNRSPPLPRTDPVHEWVVSSVTGEDTGGLRGRYPSPSSCTPSRRVFSRREPQDLVTWRRTNYDVTWGSHVGARVVDEGQCVRSRRPTEKVEPRVKGLPGSPWIIS